MLRPGDWVLQNARTLRPEQLPQPAQEISLPTDLTVARVQESFASPQTLSLWQLPSFIRLLDRSGLFLASATGCISSRCWRCHCSARRCRWSLPGFRCGRRAAAALRR